MNRAAVSITVVLAIGLIGCREPEPIVLVAPVHARASAILEPPELQIGEVATLEVVVSTPANHRVRPIPMPDEVAGLWILDSETPDVAREANRWVHRTLIRIRAREVGRTEWPASQVEVEIPDGEVQTLPLEPVAIEVHSVLPEFAGRLSPFGVDPLPAQRTTARGWLWATGGAGFTLACVGLVALARRRRTLPGDSTNKNAQRGIATWDAALAELDASAAALESDAFAACRQTSVALRLYMQRRFSADAVARTTEELEVATPPFAATSRWPRFVALLQRLDDLRFPAPLTPAEQAARASEIIDDARAFVRDTIPIGSIQ